MTETGSPFPDSGSKRIHDLRLEDRPREKLLAHGAGVLSDAELLAVFIGSGQPGANAIEIGHQLLHKHHNLSNLSKKAASELKQEFGVGPAKAVLLKAAFEIGSRAVQQKVLEKPLHEPKVIYEFMAQEMRLLNHEEVRVLLLNTRLVFMRQERISHGSINESSAHPRDILRPALIHAAYGFVLVHNHPSGDPSPSDADRRITRRVREAAELLEVQFFDHIIIGSIAEGRDQAYFSFREAGLL